ncbi:hypothetical protein phytr_4610 [Candidatus Phycorickettsia trachydisci]|uniref:Uncharacterized protein n=1 Tax=Candidatus Phycorickettsia trachydisci TaxID=2115978 RepID=A0A2P1P820_9RICK|nr:hypothetical protein [Candidatus Phycorickettsia trachydisci]AVP87411.1 hypothetical protein phytr_4610 [Candidatus Phycorickettsia trachydisci]
MKSRSDQSSAERIRNQLLQNTSHKNDKINKNSNPKSIIDNNHVSDINFAHGLEPEVFAELVKITQDVAAVVLNINNKTSLPKKPKKLKRSR